MLIIVIPSPHGTFPSTSWPVFQTENICQTVPKKENSLYCSSARSALEGAVPPVAAEGAARMAVWAPRPSHLFVWELHPSAALQCAIASELRPQHTVKPLQTNTAATKSINSPHSGMAFPVYRWIGRISDCSSELSPGLIGLAFCVHQSLLAGCRSSCYQLFL